MADYRQATGAMLAGAPQPNPQATGAPVPAGQPTPGGGPPANPAEMQDRAGGWMQFMNQVRNDPALLTAMMSMGGALMQNRPSGTNRAQQFAGALGSGMELLGGAAGVRERFKQQDVVNAQRDRALNEADRRTGIEEARQKVQAGESPARIGLYEAQADAARRRPDHRGAVHLQVNDLARAYVDSGMESDPARAYVRAQEYLKDAAKKSPEQMKAEIMGGYLENSFPDDPGFADGVNRMEAMVEAMLVRTYPNYKPTPGSAGGTGGGVNPPRRAPNGGQAIFVPSAAEAEKLPPGSYFYLPGTPPGKIYRTKGTPGPEDKAERVVEPAEGGMEKEEEENPMSLSKVLDRFKGNEFKGRLMD